MGDKAAKKLLFVVFHPMIAARENGVTIPGVSFCLICCWFKDPKQTDTYGHRLEKKEIG